MIELIGQPTFMVNFMKASLLIYSLFFVLIPSLILMSTPKEELSSNMKQRQELSVNTQLQWQDSQ